MVWEDDHTGRRRQTDQPLRDSSTGMRLWYVHVNSEAIAGDEYGLNGTFRVEVQSESELSLRRGQEVTFDRLRCRTWKTDDGRSGESYRARSVRALPASHTSPAPAVRSGAAA